MVELSGKCPLVAGFPRVPKATCASDGRKPEARAAHRSFRRNRAPLILRPPKRSVAMANRNRALRAVVRGSIPIPNQEVGRIDGLDSDDESPEPAAAPIASPQAMVQVVRTARGAKQGVSLSEFKDALDQWRTGPSHDQPFTVRGTQEWSGQQFRLAVRSEPTAQGTRRIAFAVDHIVMNCKVRQLEELWPADTHVVLVRDPVLRGDMSRRDPVKWSSLGLEPPRTFCLVQGFEVRYFRQLAFTDPASQQAFELDNKRKLAAALEKACSTPAADASFCASTYSNRFLAQNVYSGVTWAHVCQALMQVGIGMVQLTARNQKTLSLQWVADNLQQLRLPTEHKYALFELDARAVIHPCLWRAGDAHRQGEQAFWEGSSPCVTTLRPFQLKPVVSACRHTVRLQYTRVSTKSLTSL